MPQVIEVIVSSKGETQVTVTGAKGPSCKELTKGLAKNLGAVTESKTLPEYFTEDVKIEAETQL